MDGFDKRRLRSSNITVVVSISLVLFFVGLFGLIVINAKKYSDYIKERLVMVVFLKDRPDIKDPKKVIELQMKGFEEIRSFPFVKGAVFISKEQAQELAKKQLGIDTEGLFDKNIFPASVEISLRPEFVDPSKTEEVKEQIRRLEAVSEVENDTNLVVRVYNSLTKVLRGVLISSLLFLLVAVVLINNSIRLKIFSKRFVIKTMQLVGAKRSFIMLPFIREAFFLGFLGTALGLSLLLLVWYYFSREVGFALITDLRKFSFLVLLMFLMGVSVTVASTIFATWRFLRTRLSNLYYS